MIRPAAVLGAVAVTLVAGLGAADATAGRPHPPTSPVLTGSQSAVRKATVVCPDVRGGGDAQQVTWVRAAGDGAGNVSGQPSLTATAATNKPADWAPIGGTLGFQAYGFAYGGRADKGTRAIAFTGTDASAVGLSAVEVTRATTGISRGIAAAGCATPGTDFTFVGGSTVAGDTLKLVLTNVDDIPAVVNVSLLGEHGTLAATGGTGLQVPAHERVSVDLVRLAPNQQEVAATVTAVTGRVAAGELASRRDGDIPRGIEWVPPAGDPSRRLVVPGLLSDAGKKTLVLADPGAIDANVSVQLVADTGTYTPNGLESLSVPAGSVTAIDISSALSGHYGALVVTSDQPVLASAQQEVGGSTSSPDTDVSWAGQTPPLDGTALLPTVPVNAAAHRDTLLYLTAVHGEGRVTITPNGPLDPTQTAFPPAVSVTVPAGQTVVADLALLLGSGGGNLTVAVSADPSGGPVTAAAVFREQATDGVMAGEVGLAAVSGAVVLPAVRQDVTAATGRLGEAPPSSGP